MEIENKKIIITGGANGIGKSLTIKLLQEGAMVGVLDVDEDAVNKLKEDNPDIYCKVCDVSSPHQVEESVDDFCTVNGTVDILINNAGIIHNSLLVNLNKGGVTKYDIDMWDKVIAANLSSVFYMTSHVVKKMIEKRTKGLIINVSSICAAGNLGQSAYSAAKAGVNALTITWAKELGVWGIRVSGIAPGFALTDTTIRSMKENILNEWKIKTPLKRFADPLEIVDGVLFIIRNDFFNGRILEIDGGLRL